MLHDTRSHEPADASRKIDRLSVVLLRVALAASFLSAVADRFGLWGPPGSNGVAWGNFPNFVDYTGLLLAFLPAGLVVVAAWAATVAEVAVAVALLAGVQVRYAAMASCALLLSFAVTMSLTTGVEGPFSYSVWTACAASFVLARQTTVT